MKGDLNCLVQGKGISSKGKASTQNSGKNRSCHDPHKDCEDLLLERLAQNQGLQHDEYPDLPG